MFRLLAGRGKVRMGAEHPDTSPALNWRVQRTSTMASKHKLQKQLAKAVEMQHAGHFTEAQKAYDKILRQWPREPYATHYLGLLHFQKGRYDAASGLLERSIQLAPNIGEFHLNHGNLLKVMGRLEEAKAAYGQAAGLSHDPVTSAYSLGLCRFLDNEHSAALACFKEALRLRPDFPEAIFQIGRVLGYMGEGSAALEKLDRYLALRPGDPDGWNEFAQRCLRLNDHRAVEGFQRVIELRGPNAELLTSLGSALGNAGRVKEAENAHRQAIEMDPAMAPAYGNLASTLKDQGRTSEAADLYLEASQLDPEDQATISNRLLCLNYVETSTRQSLSEAHEHGGELITYIRGKTSGRQPNNRRPAVHAKPRRIGLLSPDFHRHPVGFFIKPVIAGIRALGLEVIGLHDASRSDEQTGQLREQCDEWVPTYGMPDDRLETVIGQLEVDILFDLAGHSSSERLSLFTRRVAPVQLTYLGYPSTTGLTTFDGRITDYFVDPEGSESFSSEPLLRLPGSYFCFEPRQGTTPVTPPPSAEKGFLTFGSFNNVPKISPLTLDLWATVLSAHPDSRILLKHHSTADASVQNRLRNHFARQGITAERVQFLPWTKSDADHFSTYGQIDVALDTFPYNGATTTCDALWMGVPVVSLCGETHASRVGLSLLSATGFGHWATTSQSGFLHAVQQLTKDPVALTETRLKQRETMASSTLMNKPDFACNFVRLLHEAWRNVH